MSSEFQASRSDTFALELYFVNTVFILNEVSKARSNYLHDFQLYSKMHS